MRKKRHTGDSEAPAIPVDRAWLERALLLRVVPGYAARPEAALLEAAAQRGIGPVPLFDPVWYRAQHGVSDADDPMQHYWRVGAALGLDPHPLFSVRHYLAQAPEAAPNPLQHFLQHGGPAGLDCHELFFAAWYREENPDVREAGAIPIVHYLGYGAFEGREPNPLFSTHFYRTQTQDRSARANALLHYVTEGAAAGLRPHPDFHPDRVASMFPQARERGALSAYYEVIGRAQPERAARRDRPQAEPGITPPHLDMAVRPQGEATRGGLALLRALRVKPVTGPAEAAQYQLDKIEAIHRDAASAADMAAVAAQHPAGVLLESAGLLPARRPLPPTPEPLSPLLTRYGERLYALAQRFALDPARAGMAPGGPTISLILPVYRTPLVMLERAVLSVMCQTYPDWELCVVDDCSGQPGLAAALARFAASDRRIRLVTNLRRGGISAASNLALRQVSGPYVGLLDHDDMLASDALERVAERLRARPEIDLLYTDECWLDAEDVPVRLFTKPDWSPMLLTAFMYTGHFSLYRTALVQSLGGFRTAYDFSQDYDLALRVAERRPVVEHVREVLYGWRMVAGSAASGDRPEARASNVAALQSALDRRGWRAQALAEPMSNRVVRQADQALVSIVIPSDSPELIRQAVMSITAHTSYPTYEILIVTGDAVVDACAGLAVRFVPFNDAFNFSAKCNAGAAAASGAYLVFYNDDVRVLSPGWLEAILDALTLQDVGAVAPRLLYEDHTIQHGGMITGTRHLVSTAFHGFPRATAAHANMAQSLREVSLLSGACLAVPAPVFRELGGFDAVNTPIAHSDVDFCLRLEEAGLSRLFTPHAELTHIGHVAIGAAEQEAATRRDKADLYLMRRFGHRLQDDPYFPPAMHELLAIGDQFPFRYHSASRAWSGPSASDALLVTHDLSASGAPKVVFDMARTLLGRGWQVVVMSPEDGPFRERLLAIGADVMVEPGVLEAKNGAVAFARNFDVVVANTVLSWALLPLLAPLTRTFLYAHETGLAADLAANPAFGAALRGASGVWAGSERSAAVLRPLGVDPVVLEYGTEAIDAPLVEVRGREVTIALLATVEPRKGQDLAIKAFPLLPPKLRERCHLRLHGRPHDLPFARTIAEIAAPEPRITIGPELDLEAYRAALGAADIVLCPSRDDTLPLVSLDALAAGKVLICSGDVGTAAYLEDGVSGFVLARNRPSDIAATLGRAIDARGRWPEIGEAARAVFRANFSMERFETRLLGLLAPATYSETQLRRLNTGSAVRARRASSVSAR